MPRNKRLNLSHQLWQRQGHEFFGQALPMGVQQRAHLRHRCRRQRSGNGCSIAAIRGGRTVDTSMGFTPLEGLVMRLYDQYPGDVGVFSPLLMNYLCLQPGQSFFIGANELHAYVSGECVECMALSDNVVRAGLTPKFKDVETLVNMVVYK